MPTGAAFHTSLEEGGVEVEPEFSLITGGFVPTKESSQSEEEGVACLNVRTYSSCMDLSVGIIVNDAKH